MKFSYVHVILGDHIPILKYNKNIDFSIFEVEIKPPVFEAPDTVEVRLRVAVTRQRIRVNYLIDCSHYLKY